MFLTAALIALTNEIVYVNRPQYAGDHHNTATLFQCGEVNSHKYVTQGSLKAFDPVTGKTRVIVPELPGRTIRDPDVNWDASMIVFSMRNGKDDNYHIYTVRPDGSDLKQITFAPEVTDINPAWLPEGDIVFSSTREPKYCMCNRHIMCNLYRMKADGSNIHQIGRSTLFEGHPRVMPDGRLLYDRWEYVDRNFGDAQGLWTCNTDGTVHSIFWGNNTSSPGGVIAARPITSGKVIAVMANCHDRPWGALALIDRSKGVDGKEPVLRTWPADYREKIKTEGEDYDSVYHHTKMRYSDPEIVDETHFLAITKASDASDETKLVLLDCEGNEETLLVDAPGIHSPVILKSRAKPETMATRRTFVNPHDPGYFYVNDVYVGTHMKGVKRGTVKTLRVVESPEKRNWTPSRGWFGHGEEAPAMNWHSFENKRILGTVPVEKDGSVSFEVPANTFVYFQLLDEEGKMVQSMRSGAYVQPGERYGCIGCHESRTGEAAAPRKIPIALRKAPRKLVPWYGEKRLFSYQTEVQPVFTKNCVSCHGKGGKAREKLDLSGNLGAYFCRSYIDLYVQGAVKLVGGGPAEIQPAYSWGSHASKLTRKLYGHGGVNLSDEERNRIITWMDINGVYYPTYDSAYPDNPGGRSPLTVKEHARIEELSGLRISNTFRLKQRQLLDFTDPEDARIFSMKKDDGSPVLNEAAAEEVLAILKQGAQRLAEKPRGDVMEGFVPCEKDLERNRKYERRAQIEKDVYWAIRGGKSVTDQH